MAHFTFQEYLFQLHVTWSDRSQYISAHTWCPHQEKFKSDKLPVHKYSRCIIITKHIYYNFNVMMWSINSLISLNGINRKCWAQRRHPGCLISLGSLHLMCRASFIVVSKSSCPESTFENALHEKCCLHFVHTSKWSSNVSDIILIHASIDTYLCRRHDTQISKLLAGLWIEDADVGHTWTRWIEFWLRV